MVFKTGKLVVTKETKDITENVILPRSEEPVEIVENEVLYNGNTYTVRQFSELIGSNMGWLQDRLQKRNSSAAIVESIRQIKPPTLQRNVKSLSKESGISQTVIWSRIEDGELFGDIKEDLL